MIEKLIVKLKQENKTISTMESCTGGFLASSITDIPSASAVFKFSAVTYSNEFKIKMGVSKDIIEKYSVYSLEVADQMAIKISEFSDSNFGIGITGKLNRPDKNNETGIDNEVFIAIFNRDNKQIKHFKMNVSGSNRLISKKQVIDKTVKYFMEQF